MASVLLSSVALGSLLMALSVGGFAPIRAPLLDDRLWFGRGFFPLADAVRQAGRQDRKSVV